LTSGCSAPPGIQKGRTDLPDSEVAVLRSGPNLGIRAVNDVQAEPREDWGKYYVESWRLEPGQHRISVAYIEMNGQWVRRGVNAQCLVVDLQAGQNYSLRLSTKNQGFGSGFWAVDVIDNTTGQVVPKSRLVPTTSRRTPAGATVAGTASLVMKCGTVLNSEGKQVWLLRQTPSSKKWVTKVRGLYSRNEFLRAMARPIGFTSGSASKPPDRLQTVFGRPNNEFEFSSVPNGDYFVVFHEPEQGAVIGEVGITPDSINPSRLVLTAEMPNGYRHQAFEVGQ
jgi:hypothetical protein